MMRHLVRAVVRGATATAPASASLRVDPLILRAANILPFEKVEVVHHATGARITTFAEPAAEGSGDVASPGVRAGDPITIVAWGLLHDGQTLAHRVTVVTLGEGNQVMSISEE